MTRPHEDRDAVADSLVARAKRRAGGVPIRNSFLQQGTRSKPKPGPLRELVRRHDDRALDLYLLSRAVISSDEVTENWDVCLQSAVWSRGLGLAIPTDDGTAAVSKVWRRLDAEHGLVRRSRKNRLSNITLLDESGDESPYAYPTGRGQGRYFKLSEQYWTAEERWYRTLSLPAKAMLLIGSSLKPGFLLPEKRVPDWYGISPDTASDGLAELADRDLLDIEKEYRAEPLSKTGGLVQHRYTLLAPFAQDWRSDPVATVTALPVTGTGNKGV